MNNEVSVVIAISKIFKFEKWPQYKSQSFRQGVFFAGKYDDCGKIWVSQSKERINVLFVMT